MFHFALVTYAIGLFFLAQILTTRYSLMKAKRMQKEMLAELDDPFDFNDHTEEALRITDN